MVAADEIQQRPRTNERNKTEFIGHRMIIIGEQ
jgi:hypothetical protein